jgi:hypothetical protein
VHTVGGGWGESQFEPGAPGREPRCHGSAARQRIVERPPNGRGRPYVHARGDL